MHITGALPSWKGSVQIRAYGPVRPRGRRALRRHAVFTATYDASGPLTFVTAPATFATPGLYAYQEVVPGDDDDIGLTTPCGATRELVQVQAAPTLGTTVSSAVVAPGSAITDHVAVAGLGGQQATVNAVAVRAVPDRSRDRLHRHACLDGHVRRATGRQYDTEPVKVSDAGYYTYRESIVASDLVQARHDAVLDTAETTVATGTPQIVTQVSAQESAPGRHDHRHGGVLPAPACSS